MNIDYNKTLKYIFNIESIQICVSNWPDLFKCLKSLASILFKSDGALNVGVRIYNLTGQFLVCLSGNGPLWARYGPHIESNMGPTLGPIIWAQHGGA